MDTTPEPTYQRRRMPRVRVSLPAHYSSPHLQLDGWVTDLTTEGLFFCSDYLDGQGEMAEVVLEVPTVPRPLQLRGEVRWVRESQIGGGMGIQLVDVSLDDRILIASVMTAQDALPIPMA